MREHRAFWHAGRPSGVLKDGEVRGRDVDRLKGSVLGDDFAQPHRARIPADIDAVPFLPLAGEREKDAQSQGEVFLHVGDDDLLDRRPGGGFGHLRVEAG